VDNTATDNFYSLALTSVKGFNAGADRDKSFFDAGRCEIMQLSCKIHSVSQGRP